MNRPLSLALLCASALLARVSAHAAEISLYTDDNFKGRMVVLRDTTDDLSRMNFNDKVSSIKVASGRWEVCAHANFKGACKTFERGDYPSMPGMNDKISSVRLADGRGGGSRPETPSAPSPSSPEVSPSPETSRPPPERERERERGAALQVFDTSAQRGASVDINSDRDDFVDIGFNDRSASIRVRHGYWQLCSDSNFHGSCRVYAPGSYELPRNLQGKTSSARLVDPREENQPASEDPMLLLYPRSHMGGRGLPVNRDVSDLVRMNFNDQTNSIVINAGDWEVCADAHYGGRCEILEPGIYNTLDVLDGRISSLRRLR
ncbi:beta/gamma crystallin family protein [Janthinobacterium lividum]|nr:beta/gamma crystallin family protein [Janthinobacterium lividum]